MQVWSTGFVNWAVEMKLRRVGVGPLFRHTLQWPSTRRMRRKDIRVGGVELGAIQWEGATVWYTDKKLHPSAAWFSLKMASAGFAETFAINTRIDKSRNPKLHKGLNKERESLFTPTPYTRSHTRSVLWFLVKSDTAYVCRSGRSQQNAQWIWSSLLARMLTGLSVGWSNRITTLPLTQQLQSLPRFSSPHYPHFRRNSGTRPEKTAYTLRSRNTYKDHIRISCSLCTVTTRQTSVLSFSM
jgi:hypothetical protein